MMELDPNTVKKMQKAFQDGWDDFEASPGWDGFNPHKYCPV